VLVELLNKGNNKYAKLILEHNCDSKWLMKLEDGPLVSLAAFSCKFVHCPATRKHWVLRLWAWQAQ